jgi:hypothetical protein
MSGIPMLDRSEGSGRRAQCHGLPASLLAHIERKTEEVWRSIDDLQKAVEAVRPAQQTCPKWAGHGVAELVKRLGDIRHQHRSAF